MLLRTSSRVCRSCQRSLSVYPAPAQARSRFFHSNPIEELSRRNLIQHTTSRKLLTHLASPTSSPQTIYLGIDPTAPSLHLGNLLPLFTLFHLANAGHRCIALVGGATGSIGDPSGRSSERSALDPSILEHNLDAIVQQLCDFFSRASTYALQSSPPPQEDKSQEEQNRKDAEEWKQIQPLLKRPETLAALKVGQGSLFVLNNKPFYSQINILSFLSDVGRHVRIGDMLARDSVKRRIQPSPEQPDPPGMSFTEFSYQLLQAYDFALLHNSPWNCSVQIGGSDQLGNISAGIDLIRRRSPAASSSSASPASESSLENSPAYGLTVPLLTTSSGAKFGKSAGNAVWLDPAMTSNLDLYQYFIRHVTDVDAPDLLSRLTLLPPRASSQQEQPVRGAEQQQLASHLTMLLRGEEALQRAQTASRILFDSPSSSEHLSTFTTAQVEQAFGDLPILHRRSRSDVLGVEVWKLVADVGLLGGSRAEAKRTLINGGLYLNSVGLNGKSDMGRQVAEPDLLGGHDGSEAGGRFLFLRSGKSAHAVILID
ncbi:tyrosyl-tRNA synthetase [Tilletia horrida]|uniref:tyrosine--tRNA ligase n=1 Tax=Tilletia horrida TaxID=155126 RepID=A0AAN6GSB0_9BASI|nr:tyrosyl-tRNA synthetase [Tilletia horrida]